METRFTHMNSTPTLVPALTHAPSLQSQLMNSTLSFPPHHTHTNYCLQASRASQSYPMRRPTSTNCAVPDGNIPTSGTEVPAVGSYLELKKKAADISPELKGTSIFLVGMKCSPKASLGKMLADILRYYYFDSDCLVEEAVGGTSAAKSLRERNEKDFGASETEVLKQLSSMGRLVVCAGNGAVQSSTNLALLRHGITLWIDVPLDIVARDAIEDESQFPSRSYPEVTNQVAALYNKYRDGYATADGTISLQKVASSLGCDNFDDITTEDMTLEVIMLALLLTMLSGLHHFNALREIQKLTRVKKMIEEAARPF